MLLLSLVVKAEQIQSESHSGGHCFQRFLFSPVHTSAPPWSHYSLCFHCLKTPELCGPEATTLQKRRIFWRRKGLRRGRSLELTVKPGVKSACAADLLSPLHFHLSIYSQLASGYSPTHVP